MATAYTARLIVVVRPAIAAAANQAAKLVDTIGGDLTFTAPLRLAGDAENTTRAFWCGWTMRPAEVQALRDQLVARGATQAEVVVVTAADKPTFTPVPTARAYFFDARETAWTPQEVLNVLNLDTPTVALP